MSSRALGNGDSAASSSTSTSNNIRAVHVVDTHLRGVDLAGKAVAAVTVTLNLDTESRLHVAEGSGGLEVDRVPTKLHVCISVADGVGTGRVRRPVTDWVGASTPDAAFLGGDTRGIDVVLGGCLAPVGHIGDGKGLELLDQSGNKHSLITRQDSLAERNGLSSLVFSLDGTGTILAVRLVRERLLDLAVLVTVQTAIHGHGVTVGSGLGIPLHGDLTSRASIWAVVARLARLVGAHGPSGVLFIGGDRDETSISWELALTTTLLNGDILGAKVVTVGVVMTMTGSFNARNESDERGRARRSNGELHICGNMLCVLKKRMTGG